jgi:transmembrane 9 superfamily member 2/4
MQKSPIKWASRWDTYLLTHDEPIHWFSIVNSLMIVLFLTGMVAMIMLRTLHRDIAKYNQLETAEEAQEETGWKLVHGDVFRAPQHANWLATFVGTGTQLLGMSVVTMIFAVLGFLSPANRGGLMTAMLLLFVFMGIFGGFAAACLYKQLKGDSWRSMTLRTSLLFPGTSSIVFFSLNLLVWGQASSGAVPFSTFFALCFLWFGVSVPLVFTGSYLGFKREPLEDPVRTNKIPRQVCTIRSPLAPLLCGALCPCRPVVPSSAPGAPSALSDVAGLKLAKFTLFRWSMRDPCHLGDAGARATVVHEPSALVPHRRHPALRRCLH